MICLNDVITDASIFLQGYIIRDGFAFTAITYPGNVYDAIIIKAPQNVHTVPRFNQLLLPSLQEHIKFINGNKIEKALIVSQNIDFITQCPSLKHLKIVPPDDIHEQIDYSPLYKMPQIKSLQCSTIYGVHNKLSSCIDCSNLNGLEDIHVTNSKFKNYNSLKSLKSLGLSNYDKTNLYEAFDSDILDTLSIFESKIENLDGIEKSKKMQCVYLHYNRTLRDINALSKVANTLRTLRITNCPKIDDFSILSKLDHLELLELSGSNELPDLSFLKTMKSLKTFLFDMNVKDGDLSPCLNLSYVYSERNRKHYNIKDRDLPKEKYVRGNETIDEWRRLE